MKLVHEQVHHTKFGVGTVIMQTETVIEVKFKKEFGNKKFVYPVAFEAFLKLCNPVSQGEMNDELRQGKEELESRHKMRRDAEQKLAEDLKQDLLQKKRAASKITTAAKAATKKAAKKTKELEGLLEDIENRQSAAEDDIS
ncbi:MAG: hypothetical protein EOM51_05765 [Clostridia bacterium]|nr:hypothetical protein [Clostridia bacterium]